MCFVLAFQDTRLNLARERGNDKQTAYFVSVREMSVSRENGEITRKEMPKSFLCDYDHYDMVRSRQNLNFEEIDTEPSTGKNYGF